MLPFHCRRDLIELAQSQNNQRAPTPPTPLFAPGAWVEVCAKGDVIARGPVEDRRLNEQTGRWEYQVCGEWRMQSRLAPA